MPYDGYVDFNRFLTSDVADVQVVRGYSSPLLGPSALGGSINMVTLEPLKKLDAEALIGTGSGEHPTIVFTAWHAMEALFRVHGSLDWLQQRYIPLLDDFPVYQYRNLPDIKMTDHLNNSWSHDERLAGQVGSDAASR